jgi:hypothetical protein
VQIFYLSNSDPSEIVQIVTQILGRRAGDPPDHLSEQDRQRRPGESDGAGDEIIASISRRTTSPAPR